MKIVVHDQRSASMPPEVTELQLFYEDVVDSPVADAGTVAEEGVSMKRHCYFMTEHHHNNRMGFDNYREWLFAPKSNSLIFSYSNVKEEGEQMEWRYYFDEQERCIEAKTEADDVDNGQTDKVVAKRYLKVFNLLSDVGRRALVHEFVFHVVHVGRHVTEKTLIAFAEVIEARFAIGGGEETVLGAAAVAGKEPFTFMALAG